MSGAFLLPHDGEKPFLEWLDWLQNLRLNQQAQQKKTAHFTREQPARFVAEELVKRNVRLTSGVEQSIEHLEKERKEKSFNDDLEYTLATLTKQWSLYRATLQRLAVDYFRTHSLEHPRFMPLYFRQLTFASIFNDIWEKHTTRFDTSHLDLLVQVQMDRVGKVGCAPHLFDCTKPVVCSRPSTKSLAPSEVTAMAKKRYP